MLFMVEYQRRPRIKALVRRKNHPTDRGLLNQGFSGVPAIKDPSRLTGSLRHLTNKATYRNIWDQG
jgi:hypothetical protein